MLNAQRRRRGRVAEELILRTVAANADSLLRTARRHSLCSDDAQDAYQRGLELLMIHAERLDGGNAAGWLHVVVRHEAQAIRAARLKLVAPDEPELDRHEERTIPVPEERLEDLDLVGRAAEALQRLKPQELRALWLKAEGHSYNEIAELTGWTYTKVNRCLTEGRRSFLARYATIESGAECARWLPIISAHADGEATPDQLDDLRPHLRNCPGCRSTLATLRTAGDPLAAVLPVPLVAAGVGGQWPDLVTRGYETIVSGLHERTIHTATRLQALLDGAPVGKVVAVAASAAVVVGGGYATVERKLPSVPKKHAKLTPSPARESHAGPESAPRVPAPRTADVRQAPVVKGSEFGAAHRRAGAAPEFPAKKPKESSTVSRATTNALGSAAAARRSRGVKPAPEFADASGTPEFAP